MNHCQIVKIPGVRDKGRYVKIISRTAIQVRSSIHMSTSINNFYVFVCVCEEIFIIVIIPFTRSYKCKLKIKYE